MSWLYGQSWLWYLIAFLVGVLLAWLFLVRPQQRRLRALQNKGATTATDPAPGPDTAKDTAEDDTAVFESVPPAAAVGLGGAGLAAAAVAEHAAESEPEPEPVTEQLPAANPAMSTLDSGTMGDAADDRTGPLVSLGKDGGGARPTPVDDSPTETITTGDGNQVGDGNVSGDGNVVGDGNAAGNGATTAGVVAAGGAAALGAAAIAGHGDGNVDSKATATSHDGQAPEAAGDPTTEFPAIPTDTPSESTPGSDGTAAGSEAAEATATGTPDAAVSTETPSSPDDTPPAAAATGTAGTAAVGGAALAGAAGVHALADAPKSETPPSETPAAETPAAETPPSETATTEAAPPEAAPPEAATPSGDGTAAGAAAAGAGVLGVAGLAAAHGSGSEKAAEKAADEPAGAPYGPGSAHPTADGSAPGAEYTIKGNADSMLYHAPESPYYVRTRAEAWFVTVEVAEAAGFEPWHRNRKRAAVQGLAQTPPAPTSEAGPSAGSAEPDEDGSAPTPAT